MWKNSVFILYYDSHVKYAQYEKMATLTELESSLKHHVRSNVNTKQKKMRRWNPSKEYREHHRGRLEVHSRPDNENLTQQKFPAIRYCMHWEPSSSKACITIHVQIADAKCRVEYNSSLFQHESHVAPPTEWHPHTEQHPHRVASPTEWHPPQRGTPHRAAHYMYVHIVNQAKQLQTQSHNQYIPYRIAGYFRGAIISRLAVVVKTNFADHCIGWFRILRTCQML